MLVLGHGGKFLDTCNHGDFLMLFKLTLTRTQ